MVATREQDPHDDKVLALHGTNSSAYARNSSASQSVHKWGAGVVHFLFLVNDRIPHSEIWRAFLSGAPPGSWKAAVHCKDHEGCVSNGVFQLPGFDPVPTTGTWYCHDLVTAMKQLLVGALAYDATQFTGGREKFVFVSESTLPIKPFYEIHRTLLVDDDSDFCVFPSNQWATSPVDGQVVRLLKHHQWVVLNREHAELFVKKWVPVDRFGRWRIWLKSGTWVGHERYVNPRAFAYPRGSSTCTDEWAFMATIYGALEPLTGARYFPGFGGGQIDMNSEITQGRCRTWSYWDTTYDKDAYQLATQVYDDPSSIISCYPKCHARPMELQALSSNGLHALRNSPFLFARKFSPSAFDNIYSGEYSQILYR
jgi:hypothetical protein